MAPRKTLINLQAKAHAVISKDEVYRYWLHRRQGYGVGWAVFLMLNPSTADATRSDATMRRCAEFALHWNTGGFAIANLYAARSTDPDELLEMDDPIGPENMDYISEACELVISTTGVLVVAWGAHNIARLQAPIVLHRVRKFGLMPMCLGMTKEGMPRHPLYLPTETALENYNG